jgi:hypothetical protein
VAVSIRGDHADWGLPMFDAGRANGNSRWLPGGGWQTRGGRVRGRASEQALRHRGRRVTRGSSRRDNDLPAAPGSLARLANRSSAQALALRGQYTSIAGESTGLLVRDRGVRPMRGLLTQTPSGAVRSPSKYHVRILPLLLISNVPRGSHSNRSSINR